MVALRDAVKYSAEPQQPENSWSTQWLQLWSDTARLGALLPAWGEPSRFYRQRQLFYDPDNVLVVGALSNLKTKIQQTSWEIVGPKSRTPYYQDMFQNANKEQGWDAFLSQILQDYFTIDQGAFIEVIGRGDPDEPLNQQPIGLAVLDSLRCYPTGNNEFPVWYQNSKGKLIKLHKTRVKRFVDSPSPDPTFKGLGQSAMSRAAGVAHLTMLLMRHQITSMDEAPATGAMTIQGQNDTRFYKAVDIYEGQRTSGQETILRNLIVLFGLDPAYPLKVDLTPFSQLPQNFNFLEAMQIYVNLTANALGVDPQDIFPLSSSSLGSGAQSTVLHEKGKGKAYGHVLTNLTRIFNLILPRNMEFKFKPHDATEDSHEVQVAQQWVSIAGTLIDKNLATPEQTMRLLANNVAAIGDVLLDESGQLRLTDIDPKETIADDTTTLVDTPVPEEEPAEAEKALEDTRGQFEADIANLFLAAVQGQIERRRFGIAARALIAKYGRRAYLDGLAEGGVDSTEITEEELADISRIAAEQSMYVTNVAEAIYVDNKVTAVEAAGKPQLWWNKSIMPFYQAGLESADKNGMYEFKLGATEAHCSSCLRLNGQVHRLKNWIKSGMMPQSSKLECGGWRCDCRLDKTTRKVSGSY